MKVITFKANPGEPKPGWTRLSLALAKNFSVGYFYRSEGRKCGPHHHPAEQVSVIIQGQMKVVGNDGAESILGVGDSVYFAPDEMHRLEHFGSELAIGIDIFSPARDCDLWMNQ